MMPTPLFDCGQIVRRLWPHLDGVLDESEQARVVTHLEHCRECRSHVDFARAFLAAVRQVAPDHAEFTSLQRRVESSIAMQRMGAGGDA